MGEFAAEVFAPTEPDWLERHVERATEAARAMSGEGVPVRLVRSILMPHDEVCIDLFTAPSAGAVREVIRRAGYRAARITQAVVAPTRTPPRRRW
ncbi:MAG TPA: DUF4242 domain-containing protein [Actinomycetota bacterium]|nr:DUF4242 domain-containing protein [Actinomycetota bacterium]